MPTPDANTQLQFLVNAVTAVWIYFRTRRQDRKETKEEQAERERAIAFHAARDQRINTMLDWFEEKKLGRINGGD